MGLDQLFSEPARSPSSAAYTHPGRRLLPLRRRDPPRRRRDGRQRAQRRQGHPRDRCRPATAPRAAGRRRPGRPGDEDQGRQEGRLRPRPPAGAAAAGEAGGPQRHDGAALRRDASTRRAGKTRPRHRRLLGDRRGRPPASSSPRGPGWPCRPRPRGARSGRRRARRGAAFPLVADVVDSAAVEAAVQRGRGASAGSTWSSPTPARSPPATLAETDDASWNRQIDVNLTGAFYAARAAVPRINRRRLDRDARLRALGDGDGDVRAVLRLRSSASSG